MTATICGQPEMEPEHNVRPWLVETLETMVRQGVNVFYLGGTGAFEGLAIMLLMELRARHKALQLLRVAAYPDQGVDEAVYDGILYPSIGNPPPQTAAVRRDHWMVDKSVIVVAYVNHTRGGAAKTLAYAEEKGKTIYRFPVSA